MKSKKKITNNNQKYPERSIFCLTANRLLSRRPLVSVLTYNFLFKMLRSKDREDLGAGSLVNVWLFRESGEENGENQWIQVHSRD
jgi:hypothetical protein